MTAERASRVGGRLSNSQLGYVGAALAYVVAAIHLAHPQNGLPRLLLLAATDNLGLLATDPRPVAFVLAGLALVAGVKLVLLGYPRRPIYALGMALVATFLVGYFAWHFTGHGGFLPGRAPNYHGLGPVEATVSHLRDNPIALASKAAEAALLAALAALYARDA
jgi:hypothetical protein